MGAVVTRWPGSGSASEPAIQDLLKGEGLNAHQWSNGPGDVYGAHSHPYNKVIYVVRGSIVFG